MTLATVEEAPTILELANIISKNTQKLQEYINANNLPQPTFDADGPADFPIPHDNAELRIARLAVIDATSRLHDLTVGATQSIRWSCWAKENTLSLHAIYKYKIADLVPLQSHISYTEIAKKARIDEKQIRRLIQYAMTNRIFKEATPGYVSHTRLSRVLKEDPAMMDWIGINLEDVGPSENRLLEAMEKYPGSQEPSEAPFTLTTTEGSNYFQNMSQNPARFHRFSGAMASLVGGEGYEAYHTVKGFDWASIGKGTVVDVAGSTGFMSMTLAKEFPNLQFVVQELPRVVEKGAAELPSDMSSRVSFQVHDMFNEQPVRGADVYYYRWIFHNWSDKYAIKMLKALIPALKTGARVLINDYCITTGKEMSVWEEKQLRTMDMCVWSLLNAQERSEAEYRRLFEAADPRYEFIGVTKKGSSRMSLIEARWSANKRSQEN